MKVLVTGSNGFIGRALSEQLKEKGFQVIKLTRKDGDISDPLIRKYFRGIDIVYNCAAALAHRKPSRSEYYKSNVCGVRNLLEICKDEDVKLFVHFSSVAVFNPVDMYSKTKFEAERVVNEFRRKSQSAIIIRPTIAYGPGDTRPGFLDFFKLAKFGVLPVIGGGKNFFHTIYIGNLTRFAIELSMNKSAVNRNFVIGDDPCPRIVEVIDAIKNASGATKTIHIPLLLAKICSYLFIPLVLIGLRVPLSPKRVNFLTENKKFDLSEVKKFKYNNLVGLKEGMRITNMWYKERGLI